MKNFFKWIAIVLWSDCSAKDAVNRGAYKKAFRKLWVAGALGAFFFAFVSTLPRDLKGISYPPDWDSTMDLLIRYGYLLWLIAYFLISATYDAEGGELRWRDIWFDVLQSAFSFLAAFFLGFIGATEHYEFRSAYAVTNVAIIFISLFSLWLFGFESEPVLNWLRGLGLLISVVSFLLTFRPMPDTHALRWFAGLLVGLWLILLAYIRFRLDKKKLLDAMK